MTDPRTAAGVVVFLVWRHQYFLILRDDKPEILSPNTWCPVTGGREEAENFPQAAHRELAEEIGLVPQDLIMLGVSIKGNGFFFGRLTDEENQAIRLGEGQYFDFFSYDHLSKIIISGAMKVYLDRYPEIFRTMAESEKPPFGRELGLATWNGDR
jgi:8-oxo-dGTP pyrophosphatase MutT (NUDIX family)